MADNEAPAAKSGPAADQQESVAETVDVKEVAERVYKLFCAEVRLVRVRGLSKNSFIRD